MLGYKKRVTQLIEHSRIFWVSIFALHHINHRLPLSDLNKRVQVEGVISSLPKHNRFGTTFLFNIQQINHKKKYYLIEVFWPHCRNIVTPGETWSLLVRLKKTRLNYQRWMFQKGVNGTGIVLTGKNHLKFIGHWYQCAMNRFRALLIHKFSQSILSTEPLNEILLTLLTGSRAFVTHQEWNILRATGTNHLIAIAGLHIGLLSSFVFMLLFYFFRLCPSIALYCPTQIISAYISLIVAFLYSWIAGFPLQTQRAMIMLSVFVFARVTRRYISVWHYFYCALFLILLLNPLQVLAQSFWLSFFSVLLILWAMSGRLSSGNFLWHWGRVQWVLMIGLLSFSSYFFQEISLVSVIANSIAVPWFGFIILPLCFMGLLFFIIYYYVGVFVLHFALINLRWLWACLIFLTQSKISHIWIFNMRFWQFSQILFGSLLFLAPKGFPLRILGIILVIYVFLFALPQEHSLVVLKPNLLGNSTKTVIKQKDKHVWNR